MASIVALSEAVREFDRRSDGGRLLGQLADEAQVDSAENELPSREQSRSSGQLVEPRSMKKSASDGSREMDARRSYVIRLLQQTGSAATAALHF